ncbi:MAG TPA: acetate--CoA ligase family protein, partial [Pseudolabrys sp.]|nr:acetate--CoA ligase family protein [Pseudolabrys sp.]
VALAALLRTGAPGPDEAAPAPAALDGTMRALLKPGALNEADSKRLFARFGIPVTREQVAATPAEAEAAAMGFGGNVVVKILSRDVLHKSEAGGVAIGVAPSDVARTCAVLADRFTAATQSKPQGFLVQELVSGGVELILGCHRDAQLGPTILLGMGGVTAELYRDTALRLAPVSRREAAAMIAELKSAPLLDGYRGRPVADVAALIDAIVAFSTMALAMADLLEEAEINPLFVLPRGCGVVAADGLVVVRAPAGAA